MVKLLHLRKLNNLITRELFFRILAILSGAIALFHLFGVFIRVDESPPWRHALFVCVSLFCSYGFLMRPQFFFNTFILICGQQFYSHGGFLWSEWFEHDRIDWISVVLLIVLPIIVLNLYSDSKRPPKSGSID